MARIAVIFSVLLSVTNIAFADGAATIAASKPATITSSVTVSGVNYMEDLKDSRDGKSYKAVKIGSQVWMAANLNYEMDGSMCFKKTASFCEKYGRLYTWESAKQACPAGWHLPSVEEFKALANFVGNDEKNLKSKSGWMAVPYCKKQKCFVSDYDDCDCKKPVKVKTDGNDKYGFNMLPAEYCYENGKRCNKENVAYFWTTTLPPTESFGEGQHGFSVLNGVNEFLCNEGEAPACYDQNFFSVRCLKD